MGLPTGSLNKMFAIPRHHCSRYPSGTLVPFFCFEVSVNFEHEEKGYLHC